MSDPRVVKLAQVLVHYSTKVKRGDLVGVIAEPPAQPLVEQLYRQILRAGGHPYLFMDLDGLQQIFYTEASEDQLGHVSKVVEMVYGEFDAFVAIRSQSNTHNLTNVNPAYQTMHMKAHSDVRRTYMERTASGDLKWVVTLYPTNAYAQDADMSLEEFEDYVYATTYADTDDPVAEWMKIREQQQRLVDWFEGKKKVELKGPNVDMTLSVEERKFLNADGGRNMPSGEIFTGPVEASANGWVRFTYPAVREGREIENVELQFEAGRVVKASAEKNEEYLLAVLDTDEGARYLGEFAIGTNKMIDRFIKNILFDEKIGGTIHMAVGSGYPETGSLNESAVHMDMVCDMREGGQIHVDGELIYDSGDFKI